MLSTLKDGHVNIYSSMDVGRNWSWKDDYPENLDRELRDKYLGTDYGIASGMKYRILDDNIGYVVYESFSDGIGEGNLDEVLYYLRLCDGLMLSFPWRASVLSSAHWMSGAIPASICCMFTS